MKRKAVQPALSKKDVNWRAAFSLLIPLFAFLAIIAFINVTLAGIFYVISFVALTFTRPQWALVLVFSLAPFVQDMSMGGPFKFSIGELSLVLSLPAFVITSLQRVRYPAVIWLNLMYLGACFAASVFNMDRDAITPLLQMCIYLVFAVVVFSAFLKDPVKYRMLIDGAVGLLSVLAVLAISTNFSFLSMNKNAWGASMSGGFIMALELWLGATSKRRKRWLTLALALISVCLLLTLSRGGWIAATMGTGILLALRRQFKVFFKMLLLLIPLIAVMWFMLPEQDREYATGLTKDHRNILARYQTIDDAKANFEAHPLLGVGIGYRKEIDATNIVMISLAESGIAGFGCFVFVHGGIAVMVWKTQRKISRTSVLYSPVALAMALPFARLTHGLVDHYWSRGPLLQAWAAVGMAIGVGNYLKNNNGKSV